MIKLMIVLLLFIVEITIADEAVTLTCTSPTHNEDGTTIPPTGTNALAGYKLYRSDTDGGPYMFLQDETDPMNCGFVTAPLPDGTHYFVATAYNGGGIESQYSTQAIKTIDATPVVPEPPTGLTVQPGNITAYMLIKTENKLNAIPVGTISAGTTCDSSQPILSYYVVPYEDVVMANPNQTKSIVMVASCSSG